MTTLKRFSAALLLCACAVLAACSSATQNEASAGRAVFGGLKQLLDRSPPPPKPVVTREQFAAITDPIIFVTLDDVDAIATIVRVGVNGAYDTYQGADGVSVLLTNGVIVGSRGYSDDLMHADVRGLLAALPRGQGQYGKTLSYLNGQDRLDTLTLTCTLVSQGSEVIAILGKTHRTRKMRETCVGQTLPIISTYWTEAGRVVKSQQIIAPSISRLTLEQIK